MKKRKRMEMWNHFCFLLTVSHICKNLSTRKKLLKKDRNWRNFCEITKEWKKNIVKIVSRCRWIRLKLFCEINIKFLWLNWQVKMILCHKNVDKIERFGYTRKKNQIHAKLRKKSHHHLEKFRKFYWSEVVIGKKMLYKK